MISPTTSLLSVRSAIRGDRLSISNLMQFEPYVHRHLDWRTPLQMLGDADPYLILEKKRRVMAALVCPSDPHPIAWVRMFGTVGGLRPETAWGALWEVARERLIELQAEQVASVVTESWYGRVLSNSGFEHNHDIVVMAWDHKHTHPIIPPHEGIVRELTQDDFDTVFGIDWNAFSPLWQNSRVSLQAAYDQSNICTVYEENHRILGYQISTPAPLGGHLARLAVHPDAQGQGIGYLLVQDLLDRFRQQGALRVTVNTQSDNYASLALYKKAKFQQIDRPIPVYEHKLPAGF